MISAETFITFFTASVLLGLSPGPDNIFVLTQSAARGKNAGLLITLGLCTGLIGHSLAVAFGLAVIFKSSETAFNILKYTGAAYLAYLAFISFSSSVKKIQEAGTAETGPGTLYTRGIVMNLTNPKVSIFFLAFLPQFVSPERGSVTIQLLFLGGIFIAATIIVFSTISFLSASIGSFLKKSAKAQIILNRAAGLVLLGLALKLAAASRI